MEDNEIIDLYKKGFSIKYIVDELYCRKKAKNYSFYNYGNKKVLICFDDITKTKCRGEVYKVLYNYMKNVT